jgi:hypothetical protein
MLQQFETTVVSPSLKRSSKKVTSRLLPRVCCGLLLPTLVGSCGTPEEESHPLSNKGFVLEVATNNWTKPPMAKQISNYIPQFVIKFGEGSATNMPFTLATSKNGAQDPCGPTVTGTTKVEPFALGPVELPIHPVHPEASKMLSANTSAHNFALTDVIPDGATAAEGTLTALVDIRDVYKLFTQLGAGGGSPASPDIVCEAFKDAEEAMTSCEECTGKFPGAVAGAYCLQLQADYLSATETSMPISEIASDVLTTPACAATP